MTTKPLTTKALVDALREANSKAIFLCCGNDKRRWPNTTEAQTLRAITTYADFFADALERQEEDDG